MLQQLNLTSSRPGSVTVIRVQCVILPPKRMALLSDFCKVARLSSSRAWSLRSSWQRWQELERPVDWWTPSIRSSWTSCERRECCNCKEQLKAKACSAVWPSEIGHRYRILFTAIRFLCNIIMLLMQSQGSQSQTTATKPNDSQACDSGLRGLAIEWLVSYVEKRRYRGTWSESLWSF